MERKFTWARLPPAVFGFADCPRSWPAGPNFSVLPARQTPTLKLAASGCNVLFLSTNSSQRIRREATNGHSCHRPIDRFRRRKFYQPQTKTSDQRQVG